MVTPALPSTPRVPQSQAPVDSSLAALARALRHKKEQADALVKLVEHATGSTDKGTHVNYYA